MSHPSKIEKYLRSDFWDIIYFKRLDFQIYQVINNILKKNSLNIPKITVYENNLYSNKLNQPPEEIKLDLQNTIDKNISFQKVFNKFERHNISKSQNLLLKTLFYFLLKTDDLYIEDSICEINNFLFEKLNFIQKFFKIKKSIFLDNFGLINKNNLNAESKLNINFKNIYQIYFPNIILKIIILICSCKKNMFLKNTIEKTYLKTITDLGFKNIEYLFVIGEEENIFFKDNNKNYAFENDKILIVNNNDNYEALSNKILKTYDYLLNNDNYKDINKVLKIDDDVYLNILNLFKTNLEIIEYGGHISSNYSDENSDYYIFRGKGEEVVPFTLKGEWATGGCYLFSFKTLYSLKNKISNLISQDNIYYFEDQLIGKIFIEEKIKVTYINNHLLLFLEGFLSLKIKRNENKIQLKLNDINELNKSTYHLDFRNIEFSKIRNDNLDYIFNFFYELLSH